MQDFALASGVGAGTGMKLIVHLMFCGASKEDFQTTGSNDSQAVVFSDQVKLDYKIKLLVKHYPAINQYLDEWEAS